MAKKKREWAEQKVIVKRTHPVVQAQDGQTKRAERAAEVIARRHAKKGAIAKVQTQRSVTFVTRPKECFLEFRGQKRGPHVTVMWGKLKPGADRRNSCL